MLYSNLRFIPRNWSSTLALTYHTAHNNKC